MTILKGYTCVTLLLVPKAFANGGYLFSPLVLLASFFVTTMCALKLVSAGLNQGVYSYSEIVLNTLGPKARCSVDVMIMLTEFSLTLSYMVFIIESVRSVFAVQVNPFWIAGGLVCVLTPIAWVQNIARFSFSFFFGNLIVLSAFFIVTWFCAAQIKEQDSLGPNLAALGPETATMLGFAAYAFEGIGVVMPILQRCEKPELFPKLLTAAILTICVAYLAFGTIGYLAFGSEMNE